MNWLKRIFGVKEKLKTGVKEVRLEDLSGWLDEKTAYLNEQINSFYPKIKNILKQVEGNLEILNKVDISEKKVEERIKQIVEANKEAYIKHVDSFIKHLEIPEKSNYEEAIAFSNVFTFSLDRLAKNTFRNARLASELIGQELMNVSDGLRDLRKLGVEFKKAVSEKKLKQVRKIKEQVKELKALIKTKKSLGKREEELILKKEGFEKKAASLKEQISHLKESKEYKEMEKLRQEEEKVNQEVKNIEFEIRSLFEPLQRPLRKFSQINKDKGVEKVLKEYIEDFAKALINDEGLKIADLLKVVKEKIVEGEVELREKRKKRALKILNELNFERVKGLIKKRESLVLKRWDLKEKISIFNVARKISSLENGLINLNFARKELEKEILKIKGKEERVSFSDLEKSIIEGVESITNLKIKLVYSWDGGNLKEAK